MIYMMVANSLPTLQRFGFGFLTGSEWKPAEAIFGALPFIYGTIVSSLIALDNFRSDFARHRNFSDRTSTEKNCHTDRVYGRTAGGDSFGCLWTLGNFRSCAVYTRLSRTVFGNLFRLDSGFRPLFQGRLTGIGMLTGGIILALMITPIITAVVRDILEVVPTQQREAALALGATKWETTQIVLGNAASGIAGAVVLGLGRALGETMAVTMVIGNSPQITASLFEPAYTIASVLAANFAEATDKLYLSALIEMGLVLFLVTFVVNGFRQSFNYERCRGQTGAKH